MSQQTVSIQIPPDAQSGDTLTFDLEGTALELCVPEGALAGDVLEVQLTATTEDSASPKAEPENNKTIVNLWNGSCLELFSSIPLGVLDKQEGAATLETGADGTHAHVWSAAKNCIDNVLASQRLLAKVHDNKKFPHRVLELGSGTGLLGMSYCMLATDTRALAVVLSDRSAALPLLRYNVQHNQAKLPPIVTVDCQVLDWAIDKNQSRIQKCDLILGSDLLYNADETVLSDLADTIDNNLEDNGQILLSVRWRKPEAERFFFHRTKELGITWSLLYSPRGCELSWDEFGDPKHEPSNKYFLQRTVAVNGDLTALANIDEVCIEKMSDEEHELFEQSFLQVYVGKKNVAPETKKRKLAE